MGQADPVAVLPMYDWAHVREHTDRFWVAVRDNLVSAGIAAPQTLTRPDDPLAAWKSPGLVFGQTCGLPYVEHLRDQVTLIATPDYQVPGCPPGWYCSAIVVRKSDRREQLRDYQGSCLAFNSKGSQSGWQAMLQALADSGCERPFFGRFAISGKHANSISMVAAGEADLAAIDYVSWRLAQQSMPEAREVRVLKTTQPMPGLPFIARCQTDRAPTIAAVDAAINDLPQQSREALGLHGLWRSEPADYDVIAEQKRD